MYLLKVHRIHATIKHTFVMNTVAMLKSDRAAVRWEENELGTKTFCNTRGFKTTTDLTTSTASKVRPEIKHWTTTNNNAINSDLI